MKYLFILLFSIVSFSQQITKVDFIQCNASVAPHFETKSIDGTVLYQFNVLAAIDSIRIDAKNMDFTSVMINGKSVRFKNNKKELILFEGYTTGKNKLSFTYKVTPKQTLYFTGIGAGQQIWTQGQGRYTSHWLPSFDDVNEKVIFNLNITFDEKFNALSNGVLKAVYPNKQQKIWEYKMQKPMSSYLVMLAIGDFRNQVIASKSGIPLQLFIQPKDTAKFEPTYRYSKQIFDYLEKEIGVKYPWQIYRQIPVEDFLYAGMENTSSTLFAQDFVVDENGYNDRNYSNVNAHELAHQWFGDMVTAKSGKHHWLQEGFATYYALLAERKVFGDDYFYYALYKNSMVLRKEAKTDTIPILNEKASFDTYYQKGAWALHVIRESIGEKLFQKAIKNYLKKYQFQNVETADFLNEIAKVSDFDIIKFQKIWLEDYHFQAEKVKELLSKNESIRTLFEIQMQKNTPYSEKVTFFTKIMQSDVFYPLKKEIIYQIANVPFEEKEPLLRLAMQTHSIEVRQAVAETLTTIPLSFQKDYESLLDDASYNTKEIAFTTLMKNFPANKNLYLEKAKDWIGNNDRGLRILFLTTFLDSNPELNKTSQYSQYYYELLDYTSPKYESSIRQNALEYALSIEPKSLLILKNLVNATTHHKWQMVKYARDTIRLLLKKEGYRELFTSLLPELSEPEKVQLQRLF